MNLAPAHVAAKIRRDLIERSPRALLRYATTVLRTYAVSRGEFYVPPLGKEDWRCHADAQSILHLVRYEWACAVLAAEGAGTVVDAACGCGYGTYRIATSLRAPRVHGIDRNARALAYATRHYARENIAYHRHDLEHLDAGLRSGAPEAIVSFDTVEHLRPESWLAWLDLLAPGGILILNTPLRRETSYRPSNPHHTIEYAADDLVALLSDRGDVQWGDALPCREVLDAVNVRFGTRFFQRSPLIFRKR